MVSTRKRRKSNRKLLCQLDDFDQDIILGNTVSDRQENATVNEGTGDRDFSVGTSDINLMTNRNTVNVKTLDKSFFERIDKVLGNIVDTVEDRIQNAILTAIDSIVAPKVKLVIRAINMSFGRDVTSVAANSESGELIGVTAPSEY